VGGGRRGFGGGKRGGGGGGRGGDVVVTRASRTLKTQTNRERRVIRTMSRVGGRERRSIRIHSLKSKKTGGQKT